MFCLSNRKLNGMFDCLIVRRSFCWRVSESLKWIDSTEDVDFMKDDFTNAHLLLVSISFMVVASQSCLCGGRFWLYWYQTCSKMALLLEYTYENDFFKALLIIGKISAGNNPTSPIICSIRKVSISCFFLTMYIFMFSSVLLSLHLATMIFRKEHRKDSPFVIFIIHTYFKPDKKTTVSINQRHRNNTIFLIIFIQFQII